MKKKLILSLLFFMITGALLFKANFNKAYGRCTPNEIHRAGCCSHHGGVCGCNQYAGRLRCCDGTISPSCGC